MSDNKMLETGTNSLTIKKKKQFITPKTVPYLFVGPALLLFIAFTVYPIIASFLLSFQTKVAGVYTFSGLANYTRLFSDPLFYKALGNTFIILLVQVPIMLFLAVLLASVLNSSLLRMKVLPGRFFYSCCYFISRSLYYFCIAAKYRLRFN